MPYSIKGNCVYRGDKELKCYDNHEDAVAYFRALQANVKDSLHEFSMYISKSSISNGVMRWLAVNSDTDWDLYGERMSLELYKSMITKIKLNAPPPESFAEFVTSDFWKGGMPYLSIAHFADGNGKAVPGDVRELFIDGNQLKAKGTLHNTPLGNAVWKSLKQDEVNYKNSIDTDRIRISIAFLDLAHKHGEGGEVFKRNSLSDVCQECRRGIGEKIYLDGYLVHLALTRVPVNPRTIMLPEEETMAKKSKPETRLEDAVSVLGDETLAEGVAESNLETKSLATDAMVEMADTEEVVTVEVKSYDEASPLMWKPYGGATSMKEAKKFVDAQKESWRVSDLYYTFTDVAKNIMDSEEIEDKSGALASLVDEFKKGLVAKSLYEELSQIREGKLEETYMAIKKSDLEDVVSSVVQKSIDSKKNEEEKESNEEQKEEKVTDEKSEAVEVPVQKSALELSMEKLYNSVTSVVAKAAPAEEKLQEIQPILNEVGQTIISMVRGEPVEQKSEVQVSDVVLEQVRELSAQLSMAREEIAQLKSSITDTQGKLETARVPVPRSISPTITKSEVPAGKPNSVMNIARRSVGL